MTNLEFEQLMENVKRHKLEAFLYHFSVCNKCKKFFNTRQLKKMEVLRKQKELFSKIISVEVSSLNSLFKKNKLVGLLYKDLRLLPLYKNSPFYKSWVDIDIISDESGFEKISEVLEKKGWKLIEEEVRFIRIKNYQWEEKVYSKKKDKIIRVDLQKSIGYIYTNPVNLLTNFNLESIVKDALKDSSQKGLIVPSKEFQLILNILHFALHDNFFGLRQALEIKDLALELNRKEWMKCSQIATKNNLQKHFWFTLLVIEKLFSRKLIPDYINAKIPLRHVVISFFYPIYGLQNLIVRTGVKMFFVRLSSGLLNLMTYS